CTVLAIWKRAFLQAIDGFEALRASLIYPAASSFSKGRMHMSDRKHLLFKATILGSLGITNLIDVGGGITASLNSDKEYYPILGQAWMDIYLWDFILATLMNLENISLLHVTLHTIS
ncbi:hypothetical protein ACJX0J_028423, partial [Zea mays]